MRTLFWTIMSLLCIIVVLASMLCKQYVLMAGFFCAALLCEVIDTLKDIYEELQNEKSKSMA